MVKIMDVKPVHNDWGDILLLSFDVEEGDKKGFFRDDYRGQTYEDKKWRGTYRLRIPADDGSDKDAWAKNAFNNAMFAFEDSNKGFRFDWDENKLKGLLVGALFRNEEWEMNGRTGWTTNAARLSRRMISAVESLKRRRISRVRTDRRQRLLKQPALRISRRWTMMTTSRSERDGGIQPF